MTVFGSLASDLEQGRNTPHALPCRMVDSELLCGADRSETAQKIIDAIGSRLHT